MATSKKSKRGGARVRISRVTRGTSGSVHHTSCLCRPEQVEETEDRLAGYYTRESAAGSALDVRSEDIRVPDHVAAYLAALPSPTSLFRPPAAVSQFLRHLQLAEQVEDEGDYDAAGDWVYPYQTTDLGDWVAAEYRRLTA